jgi:hypothetical protein
MRVPYNYAYIEEHNVIRTFNTLRVILEVEFNMLYISLYVGNNTIQKVLQKLLEM